MNQHPAAHLPNEIIQNTQMCSCVSGGYPECSPRGLWEWCFDRKYFHWRTFRHCWATLQMFLRAGPHQASVALQGPIFKIVNSSPWAAEAAIVPHIPSLLPTNLRWWFRFAQCWWTSGRRQTSRCAFSDKHRCTITWAEANGHAHTKRDTDTHTHWLSLPTTINVNSNPLLTDFLYTWLGRLAKPT